MNGSVQSDHRVPHTQHVVGSGILPSCYFWGTLRTNNRQLRPRYRTTATKPYKSLIYFSICVVGTSCLSLLHSVTMDNTPIAAFNQGVETADTAPWAVDAFRSPGDGPPPLPSRGAAILIIRVGEPLGRARAGWRSNVDFDIGEGYAVFKEKCIARYEALIAGPEALKKPLALPEDVSSKPRTNLKQSTLS
ncbi:hypothetical protein, variant [Phytophthora nicotianae]|uniref:Uncharacterized protein n=3 Tax=Phytophthora nicotianae TaxID=4792 RepID=W2IZD7_PHYNI|nr:hypothetical protein L916_09169 [Phytophthora nicotianae]ETL39511.1 hypothetical protein, variant 1 [Phytophthora nicotianae]ETL92642.1 hypothetical protein L917_09092 [Phytophthora nicotianae]ETL92643.1 hypothetical protein, variant [Phytophthora nicotianae]ETM45938.1 hypothetical protein L914_09119 [Phytophthora nicotianae]